MSLRTEDIHVQSDECGDTHCHSCGVDEPLVVPYSRTCYECNHMWVTTEQLLIAHNKETYRLNKEYPLDPCDYRYRVEEITFCPLCYHDF